MARRSWDDPWTHYAESKPLPAEDGIATSRRRGAMAATWWSQRFVEILESYGLGARMRRGRRYARSGQVLSVDVSTGLVAAQVQGSRRKPYLVTIRAAPPSDRAWRAVEDVLRSRVGFVARLLAGEMPPELEEACASAGAALFPEAWPELDTRCSCPDWEDPCKHLAAVLYVFADQLDADPWLLLAFRGRTREELLAHLEAAPGAQRADGLPSWWPLVPGSTRLHDVRWHAPTALPPLSSAAALARLEPLDVTERGAPLAEFLAAAYPVLVAGEAFDTTSGGDRPAS